MNEKLTETGYDIIGDIHGHADALISLLEKMGYDDADGFYRHPTRKAIFLGDFVDRGPQQKLVLNTVMNMVKNESALAVMGNHEFNALAFHTENPTKSGTWLRPRDDKNISQHIAFLKEYLGKENEEDLQEVLNFFYTLPLWLELDGLRVIHAAWHTESMTALKGLLGENNTLTEELLVEASTKGTAAYEAVEILLKGMEHQLPPPLSHRDKDDNKRTNVRYWFFKHSPRVLKDVIVHPESFDKEILDVEVSGKLLCGYGEKEPPVFVGHYWMDKVSVKHPARLTDNVACLDYSVAKGGDLVAYRWCGESSLDDRHFIF